MKVCILRYSVEFFMAKIIRDFSFALILVIDGTTILLTKLPMPAAKSPMMPGEIIYCFAVAALLQISRLQRRRRHSVTPIYPASE
jgi:hypothetical protein